MKVFTIIKDQSQRVANKNFRLLGRLPLRQHLIGELSQEFEVTINTDSERLIQQIDELQLANVNTISRNQKYIDWENNPNIKTSPVQDMLFDFCTHLDPEVIVILTHVTSPFLSLETLKDATRKLETDKSIKSIHSVAIIKDFTWMQVDQEFKPINFDPKVVQQTQDLPPLLVSKGAFFIARAGDILAQRKRLPEPVYYYPLNPVESIEIDTEDDLAFACALKENK